MNEEVDDVVEPLQGSGAAGTEVGTRRALRRVVLGYRVVSAAWLTVLGVVVLSGGGGARAGRPGFVLATLLLVVAWTVVTLVVGIGAPDRLGAPALIAVDVAVALWCTVAPIVADATPFYGGYPFSAIVLAVYGLGLPGAASAAAVLAAGATWRRLQEDASLLTAVNDGALLFLFGAGVLAWGVEVLRRAERQRFAYEDELAREREERRRSAEHAETAAHLHDSVLQTLALLQRRAGDPVEVATLARRQERELRDWLAGARPAGPARTYRAALEQAAAEVERDHRIAVEAVVVGDAPLDDRLAALVGAAREALVNAAKHAGVDRVALYAEADGRVARAYARDRGRGFAPEPAGGRGRGIAESIVGRLDRHGGQATIRSAPGDGTEVALSLPLV